MAPAPATTTASFLCLGSSAAEPAPLPSSGAEPTLGIKLASAWGVEPPTEPGIPGMELQPVTVNRATGMSATARRKNVPMIPSPAQNGAGEVYPIRRRVELNTPLAPGTPGARGRG